MNNIDYFMTVAIEEAKKSGGDIPVGCVIEKNGEIIAKGFNLREKTNNVSSHAEIEALVAAGRKINNWRLEGCNIYVTLEPCPMCAWAIINSRVHNVYFGAYDLKYGAFGSKINLNNIAPNKVNVYGGIKEDECKKILNDYFLKLRN